MSHGKPTRNHGPVFIIGSPRSGTTAFHWSLVQHPELWGDAESDFLLPLLRSLPQAYQYGMRRAELHWLANQGVSEAEFLQAIGAGIDTLYRSRSGEARWVDKTPQYVFVGPQLARMFPSAKFLVLFRDGRQVAASMQSRYGYSFWSSVTMWADSCVRGLKMLESYPDRCLPVCFEELVLHPKRVFEHAFEFLDEPYCDASRAFFAERRPMNSADELRGESSRDKLTPRWLGWSLSRRLLFQLACNGMLQRLGYETDRDWLRSQDSRESGADAIANRVVGYLRAIREPDRSAEM